MSEKRKEISKVIFNDRYGYAVAYYTPHMKDPALEIIERSKKINLPKTRKPKPEPTRLWKLRETPSEFLKRKQLEYEIELVHDMCGKAKFVLRKQEILTSIGTKCFSQDIKIQCTVEPSMKPSRRSITYMRIT